MLVAHPHVAFFVLKKQIYSISLVAVGNRTVRQVSHLPYQRKYGNEWPYINARVLASVASTAPSVKK